MNKLSSQLPTNILASCLNVGQFDFTRVAKGRSSYRLHVSDIIRSAKSNEFCPREYVLAISSTKKTVGRYINPGSLLLFSTGNSTHDHVRNHFIKHSEYGRFAWGVWFCSCGKTHKEGYKPNSICTKCKTRVEVYGEISLVSKKLRVVGHPDFIIKYKGIFYIYEIKTIDRKDIDFEQLKHPLGDHVLQASIYYYLMKSLGYNVSPNIRYLYGDRDTKKMFGGTVYKEFISRAAPMSRLSVPVAKAKVVKESLEEGLLPTRICEDCHTSRAGNCSQVVACFNTMSRLVRYEKED